MATSPALASVRFLEEGHRYVEVSRTGERPIPSVSEILAGAGLVNYNGISPEVLRLKAEFGSAVHLATALDDENDLANEDELDPKVLLRLQGWRKFRADFGFEPDEIERPTLFDWYSMRYGGTPDRRGVLRKETGISIVRAVVEIKTTVEIEVHHRYQLAAYAMGKKNSDGNKDRRLLVQLLDDGDYKPVEFKDSHDEQIFSCALALEWEKRNQRLK